MYDVPGTQADNFLAGPDDHGLARGRLAQRRAPRRAQSTPSALVAQSIERRRRELAIRSVATPPFTASATRCARPQARVARSRLSAVATHARSRAARAAAASARGTPPAPATRRCAAQSSTRAAPPPAPRRRARPARGTASTTRSRARSGGRSRSSPGRRRARRRCRASARAWPTCPSHAPIRTSCPTPGRVDRLERRAVEDLQVDVAGEDPALDVVAREAERGLRQVVRAEARRSRRASAIASARKHARGSSIIVPIEVVLARARGRAARRSAR